MTRPVSFAARRPARAFALALAMSGAAAAFAAPSPADGASQPAAPAPIRPVLGVLVTGTLGSNDVTITNADGSTASGNLSGRYEGFAGAEFPLDPDGLALRLTAGVHVTSSFTGIHGSEHATSIPLEATLWYPVSDTVRVGGGARYAMRTRFSGAGGRTPGGLNATPALVVGAGVRLLPHLLLDLRYVYERYERASGIDAEASHWGAGLTAIY